MWIASRSSLGGKLPGLAIFSLLVLSVVVTTITLLQLKPWGGDTAPPPPSPPPFAIGVGGAVALSGRHGPSMGVAEASAVGARKPALTASGPVGRGGGGAGNDTAPAIAPAQVVSVGTGEEVRPAPIEPSPVPPPPAKPVSVPVEQPAPAAPPTADATPAGPIRAAAVPGPICESDESTVTVGDEGDLADAESTAIQLVSEGPCVTVQIVQPEGGNGTEDEDEDEDEGDATVPVEEPSP